MPASPRCASSLSQELAGSVRFRPHGQKQVRAIERAHENPGTADEQLLGDFRPRRLVRGRRHRDHLDALATLPRPRAGADIQGGNRGPIARRNAPRRWREDRPWPSSRRRSCRRARAARARHREAGANARRGRARSLRRSSGSEEELRLAASTPASRNWATWSRIRAISGETTSVSPPRTIAGSWKRSDLPLPVGMTASTSSRANVAARTSSCPGRKSEKPKTVDRADRAFVMSEESGAISRARRRADRPKPGAAPRSAGHRGRLADRASERPDEIERAGDEQPGVGFASQFEAALKRSLRVRLDLAYEPKRLRERAQLDRRAAPA